MKMPISHQIIEDEAGTFFWFEGISADSYALQIKADGTLDLGRLGPGHLEVSGNAPVHGHDHHATLDQRQLADHHRDEQVAQSALPPQAGASL